MLAISAYAFAVGIWLVISRSLGLRAPIAVGSGLLALALGISILLRKRYTLWMICLALAWSFWDLGSSVAHAIASGRDRPSTERVSTAAFDVIFWMLCGLYYWNRRRQLIR